MDSICINGGNSLYGEITVQGSKNSVLPIMAASLLNKGTTVIHNCPQISDVSCMIELLKDIGCSIYFRDHLLIIDSKDACKCELDNTLANQLRASVILIGPLLARFGCAKMSKPGGCNIGERPIDIHLDAFKSMNADYFVTDDAISVETKKLSGSSLYLKYPSVGATENIILAAVLADGVTEIRNAAVEPEIVELCKFLTGMGAEIAGIGTGSLKICGVDHLNSTQYKIRADRIVMGTYMCACMSAGGEVRLNNCRIGDGIGYIDVLYGMGADIRVLEDAIVVKSDRPIQSINHITTMPYPGFPTDMQPIVMSVLCRAQGKSVIKETIFNNRLELVSQLVKMGALIEVVDNVAVINGVNLIHGEHVKAQDLRGGAALVIAGLSAEGVTTVSNPFYIKRGYEDICSDLKGLGADIKWSKQTIEEKVNLK